MTTDKKVWLVTGAGRGMGVDLAKAALAAGHAVVATGRNTDTVKKALGEHDDLLAAELDVTSPASAETAVAAAVERFGRIDLLVNNAGNFYAGYFEELTPEQIDAQLAATLLGPMNVTRVVLPVMRKQRSGLLLTISSTAGIAGQMFCTAYAAAKPSVPTSGGQAETSTGLPRCLRSRPSMNRRSSGSRFGRAATQSPVGRCSKARRFTFRMYWPIRNTIRQS